MRIFISIASYQDFMLEHTVNSCYDNAKYKNMLEFGILDQTTKPLEFDSKFTMNYVSCPPSESEGACWARSRIQKELMGDQDIYMQIDSHILFEKNWDEYLIKEYNRAKTWIDKPVITGYPRGFSVIEMGDRGFNTDEEYIFKKYPKSEGGPHTQVMKVSQAFHTGLFSTAIARDADPKQYKGFMFAGGFVFTEMQWALDVPYDPKIFFSGEEPTLALRSFTKGYDIVHVPETPVWHWYNGEGIEVKRECIWDAKDHGKSEKLSRLGEERTNYVLAGNDYEEYGLGTIRTMDEYAHLSGLDYINKTYAPDKGSFECYMNSGWEEEELG